MSLASIVLTMVKEIFLIVGCNYICSVLNTLIVLFYFLCREKGLIILIHLTGTGTPACAYQLTSGKHDMEQEANFAKPKGFGWDLNAEDVSTSPDENPFHPYKNLEYHKSIDASECGSSTGPLEEKDPMRVWKEMKQNGFLSSSHGGIPIPKPRGRKSKFDGPKKKMEIAKREQVDRFAKIAAPSGLLNELNPGIINHVRNSKQVLSIIEALVRSEKLENRKQAIPMKSERNDFENANMVQMNHTGPSYEDGSHRTLGGSSQQKRGFPNSKDDILALKLSSSTTKASENISSLSNEDSENISSVSSLSVKGKFFRSLISHSLLVLHFG